MVPTGPAWHLLIPDPTGNPAPRVSRGNPGNRRKGARDEDRISNQNRCRGVTRTGAGVRKHNLWGGNSSHHLGFPQPPKSLHPPKTQHQCLRWNLPKSLPRLCHSPSKLKGTKPLRYKLMLKLFVKHLKFSVTYLKYPPCSPDGGVKAQH